MTVTIVVTGIESATADARARQQTIEAIDEAMVTLMRTHQAETIETENAKTDIRAVIEEATENGIATEARPDAMPAAMTTSGRVDESATLTRIADVEGETVETMEGSDDMKTVAVHRPRLRSESQHPT